jgi:ubiquitin carboxyl-terminal hydrolase 4/11/15
MKSNTQQVVTAAAYLLFYRRREDHPLGGPILTEILEAANTKADSEEPAQKGSREPSPHSGEGRRLGDSSHNGSSSAFRAGQAHRVGDGGSAITKTMTTRGMTGVLLEDGSPLKSVEMTSNDDEELPPYSPNGMSQHFSRNMGEGLDEGIDTSMDNGPVYGPHASWHGVNSGWSFESIKSLNDETLNDTAAAPPGSPDEDLFQDTASTRVEGGDDSGVRSPVDWLSEDEVDPQVHDLVDGFNGSGRGMRESAPPPDGMEVDESPIPVFVVPPPLDDEDEDLPVHELLPPGSA